MQALQNTHKTLILKITGSSCNLACHYCYEAGKHIKRSPDVALLEIENIEKTLRLLAPYSGLTVILHGGESLLAPTEYLDDLFELLRKESRTRRVRVGVQTNGTCASENLLRVLSDNEALVNSIGFSIDGTRTRHDRVRPYKSGRGSWQDIRYNFVQFRRSLPRTRLGIIAVVSQANIDSPADALDAAFCVLKADGLSLSPCMELETPSGEPTEWSIWPKEYLRYLEEAFNYAAKHRFLAQKDIKPFNELVAKLLGLRSKICLWDTVRKCQAFVTLYPGGRVYPCDEWARDDETLLLDLNQDMICTTGDASELISTSEFETETEVARRFFEVGKTCDGCDVASVCGGGCYSKRYLWKNLNPEFFEDFCTYRRGLINFMQSKMSMANVH